MGLLMVPGPSRRARADKCQALGSCQNPAWEGPQGTPQAICARRVHVFQQCWEVLPFQPFPLQEAIEVQAVEVVSKGSHTQVVVDKPRREQSQQAPKG